MFEKLAEYIVFDGLGLEAGLPFTDALQFFVGDTVKILTLLFGMIYIIGFGRSFLNPSKVRSHLNGRSRFVAYGLAALLGTVTPFCSCSSIPLFIAFLSAGIPLGVTMAFLIVSPLVNEVVVVLLGQSLGMHFTLLYVTTGVVLGVVGGVIVDALRLDKWVEPFVYKATDASAMVEHQPQNWRERELFARGEAIDIVKTVWAYVLLGVGLGAALHGYLPEDWIVTYAGKDNPWAVPVAVLSGIPLYANATSVVPVAEVLLSKGLPIGTTLAFIMSVVGISLPELMILRRVVRVPLLVFFAGYIFVALMLVGYLFNAVF